MSSENTIIHAAERFRAKVTGNQVDLNQAGRHERLVTLELIDKAITKSVDFFVDYIKNPPDELILQITIARLRLKEMGFNDFTLAILPDKPVNKTAPFLRKAENPPPADFFNNIDKKHYPADTHILNRGIYILDTTQKPDTETEPKEYKNDSAMTGLLNRKHIKNKILLARKKEEYDAQTISRFDLTAWEIDSFVLQEITNDLEIPQNSRPIVRLPRFIEYNMIANMTDAGLGTGCTEEWFGDDSQRGFGITFVGGKEVNQVRPVWKNHRSPSIGFRPMIFFPY